MGERRKLTGVVTSILLFVIVFILWQIYDIVMLQVTLPLLLTHLLYLSIPGISLVVFAVFVVVTGSSFKGHGYMRPVGIGFSKCLLLSCLFAAIYVFATLAQGVFGNFGTANFPTEPYQLIFRLALAVIFAVASESIFRGYILRNLVRKYGFFSSLYASSILFSLHNLSLTTILAMSTHDIIIYIFTAIIPALAAGIFFGFYFYKIGWSLLGPIAFRMIWLFFLEPLPLMSASSPWWIALTFELMAFVILIFALEALIREPLVRRRRYGLEG
ncbi:MAG: CPBP family glutamic-type intramembrane protease [Candidatus Bathyarchaeota archaeon]|nr:CPBP family glutamic-type intramembrane protease [Candidatus Bathyarchaeota archaeon]